jgi:hypothetical protein
VAEIPIPDTSQLGVVSPATEYNLRNASAAITPLPSVSPPPGGIGYPEATGSIDELNQRSLQSFQNPGQFVPEIPQDFQQPQFPQPQGPDPFAAAEQAVLARQQARASRGHGIRALLGDFMGGAGRAMMLHSGLATPEQQDRQDLADLTDIQTARTNAQLKNLQAQDLQLRMATVTVQTPEGPRQIPRADAEHWYATMATLAAKPDKSINLDELYASSVQRDLARGLRGPSPETLQIAERKRALQVPAETTPDRETFDYYTRPKEQGGLGLSPAQAYSAMHPRQNLTMGSTDVKDIADAIENGDQPPTLTGLYRNAAPVRAELARRGVPIARMEMDWNATKKYMSTLNGPQQVRLRQAIETAGDSLDKIQGLYDEWQKLALVSGFKIANHAALVAMKNLPGRAGAVANSLDAQIADLTAELGNVYMGGNSPTDHSLKLAQQNLSSDWGPQAFEEAMKQARLNIGIRKNSITHGAPAGVSGENTYMPPAPAVPQTAAPVDPFAQFGGKAR